MKPAREVGKAALRLVGLLGLARETRRRVRAMQAAKENALYRSTMPSDGLPLPPAHLISLVTGTPSLRWYSEAGRNAADSLQRLLADNAVPLDGRSRVLDFGCGCGRVIRHWASTPVQAFGTDYNGRLIRWCRRHLAFARFDTNQLSPPLGYTNGQFDFVYALSVFTHLPAALQRPWMEELARILRPGGHLAVSLHGERYRSELGEDARQAFDRGELAVLEHEDAGTNICGAYHPRAYVECGLVPGLFRIVDFRAEGATGNPHQDLYLLRRL